MTCIPVADVTEEASRSEEAVFAGASSSESDDDDLHPEDISSSESSEAQAFLKSLYHEMYSRAKRPRTKQVTVINPFTEDKT